jgi:hypothetical protein
MTWRTSNALALAAAALLLVTGCGSSDNGESATPAPTHAAEAGEPALPQVEGYEYQDLTGSDAAEMEALRAELDAANAEMPGAFVGFAAHEVTGPAGTEFMVMEIQVGPALVNEPQAIEEMTAGMAGFMVQEGMTVRMGTMGDVDVAQAVGDDVASCTWNQSDLVFMVFGADEDSVNEYAEALIQACEEL